MGGTTEGQTDRGTTEQGENETRLANKFRVGPSRSFCAGPLGLDWSWVEWNDDADRNNWANHYWLLPQNDDGWQIAANWTIRLRVHCLLGRVTHMATAIAVCSSPGPPPFLAHLSTTLPLPLSLPLSVCQSNCRPTSDSFPACSTHNLSQSYLVAELLIVLQAGAREPGDEGREHCVAARDAKP